MTVSTPFDNESKILLSLTFFSNTKNSTRSGQHWLFDKDGDDDYNYNNNKCY